MQRAGLHALAVVFVAALVVRSADANAANLGDRGHPAERPPNLGVSTAPTLELSEVAFTEVTVDDDSLEILAFSDSGALIAAMLVTPNDEVVQIDATFVDGYASIALELGDPDSTRPLDNLQTDLDPDEATARVTSMFELAVDDSGSLPRSRRSCMFLLATTAAYCGVAAAVPPASAIVVAGCLGQFANALCACSDYLPLNIC